MTFPLPVKKMMRSLVIVPVRLRGPWMGIFICLALTLLAGSTAWADISRPAGDHTRVDVLIFVIDVDEIDSANQNFAANVFLSFRWQDPRLAHSGTKSVSRSMNEVWHPRIQIINQQKVWRTFPEVVEIDPKGNVVYRQRVWGSFSQPLKLRDFPFDRQVFSIQLAAVGYAPDEIELVPASNPESGIAQELSLADWSITGWEAAHRPYEPVSGEITAAGFAFSFEAKRLTGYFIIKVIIPLILIVAMSWVVFWIDPLEAGPQISVAITTMLTLIAYRFAVGTSLPKVSYLTRLDYFILISTILVYASLIEVIITSSLAKSEKLAQARTIDRWMRFIFPGIFIIVALKTLVF